MDEATIEYIYDRVSELVLQAYDYDLPESVMLELEAIKEAMLKSSSVEND